MIWDAYKSGFYGLRYVMSMKRCGPVSRVLFTNAICLELY
ncbi:hypothetical protein L21SP2_1773 [Salinispira pacifica]|uniref:Uncharacterized protein n=1 Tax=Salinispira pacifica TaxID=1307761 RepID=V5WHQ4_9SPIO|nr:hypothetical protein L21SP2_1773 [Salinispira pacifica]